MPEEDQPRLPIELPERAPRRRGRGRRRSRGFVRRNEPPALMRPPVRQRCGRCGRMETVLGDAAICGGCGSVILRGDEGEE